MTEVRVHATNDSTLKQSHKCKDYAVVSEEFAAQHGLSQYQHIRIDNHPFTAYYRIMRIRKDKQPFTVHESSLNRFNGSDGITIELSQTVPQETFEEAFNGGGVNEVLEDDGDQDHVLVIAPHGGRIEAHTHKLADNCYEMLQEEGIPVSLWKLQGYTHSDQDTTSFRAWHFSMIMRSQESYPQLQQIVNRNFDYVVGFHRSGYEHVEVGGKATQKLRDEVGAQFRQRTNRSVRTDTSRMHNPGTAGLVSENYLCNSRKQALHIECTPGICKSYQESGAQAVVDVLKSWV